MDILRDNRKGACGCCAAVVVLVVSIIVIIFCAGTVEPIEYGLVYSKISKNIDTSAGVYEGGWYLIGPMSSFLAFPRTQVNVEFSNNSGSKQRPVRVFLASKN